MVEYNYQSLMDVHMESANANVHIVLTMLPFEINMLCQFIFDMMYYLITF